MTYYTRWLAAQAGKQHQAQHERIVSQEMRAVLISLCICLWLRAAASSQADLQALSAVIPDIQAGAWQRAEHELLDALKQFPQSAVLSNALGIVYEKEGKTDLAIHAYEQATQWLPSFTAAQLHLASLQASNGKCEVAAPVFLAASQSTSDLGALSTAGLWTRSMQGLRQLC